MGARLERARRALTVGRVAHQSGLRRILAEIGLAGRREATREGAQSFRRGLEELGPTFIKLGQLLSSRPDLLPDVYIDELGGLVDDVPSVPFAQIEAVLREDFGDDAFVSIDPEPLATASIAQTHRGLLATGQEVVAKVRRPGVVEQVELDLPVLRSTARVAVRHSESAQRIQLEELADELELHLRAEMDFLEEAHNTELVRRLVEPFDGLVVPRVIQPYVSERALVLELIHGRRVEPGHGLEPERAAALAREFFRAYVFQIVVEGVYHADPHHGNVLLTEDSRLGLLDFGLLGRLDEDTRAGLALLLLALAQNRADDVAELVVSLSLTSTRNAFTQLAPLARLPGRLGHVVSELERGTLTFGVTPTGLGELEHNLRSIANRIGGALIVGALLLASSLLVRVHAFEWLGVAGFCLAAVLGLYMVWKIIRTPGEL